MNSKSEVENSALEEVQKAALRELLAAGKPLALAAKMKAVTFKEGGKAAPPEAKEGFEIPSNLFEAVIPRKAAAKPSAVEL